MAGGTEAQAAATVFLSYARADRARVALLARALSEAGHEVWWDAMIEGGAAFAKKIEAQLEAADAVVVAWSRTSVASDWVRDEAAHARDSGKLVPVTLDGTAAPLGFRQYHLVDLSGWKGNRESPEIDSLVNGIAAVGGEEPSRAPRLPPAPRLARRTVLLGGAAGIAAAGGALMLVRPWEGGAAQNSVAVLPFQNLSGDPAQAYFSDGLAEEVRTALSRNPALKVAAPTSSNMFREKTGNAKAIASQLGVAFLLEGSVRKSGDLVRIAAQLIDAATGFAAWSQDFERRIADIFAVQTEIAATVADALAVRVAQPGDRPGATAKAEAFDAYLRGRALFNSDEGEASDRAALGQFEAAIAIDPGYAMAHAARSRTLAALATQYAGADTLRAMYDEAIAAARRSVELAPGLAAAHLALGYAIFTGRLDFRASREPFDRAYALGKGDADIDVLYALYAARAGRSAPAAEAIQRAIALDPLNPRAWRASASVEYAVRRYARAIPAAQRALTLNPKISNSRAMIGNAMLMLGRLREARAAYDGEPNHSFRFAGLAIVDRKLGNAAAAEQSLAGLKAEFGDSALYQQAQILAQWGQAEAALTALEGARRVGDSGLLYMATDPMLDPVRKDARFTRLLAGMGLA